MCHAKRVRIVLVVFLCVTYALGFKPYTHEEITLFALLPITKTVNSHTYKFSGQALSEIEAANKGTDCGGAYNIFCLCYSCQADSSRHFDDENFFGASSRLVTLKQKIIAEITIPSPDGAQARQDLGTALHTVQDFYSHSTRVELGLSAYDSLLGKSTFRSLVSNPLIATCPATPSVLGGAGLTDVTSGYFDPPNVCAPPPGKCIHGLNIAPIPCEGINKDTPAAGLSYTVAYNLAKTASADFVNSILNDSAVTTNEKAIRALMGIKSTLGFVIDTTGSMSDIIGEVKVQVAQIVNSIAGTPNEPDQYLLEPYNDPFWGPAFTTDNASEFINAVNALVAAGGGDCPELPLHGDLDAISASYPNSKLYLFTDASAKDGYLATSVIAAANAKNIQGNFLNFGSCSPIDPSYVQVANATGGQAFFLARTEAGKAFALVRPQLGVEPVTLAIGSGTLNFVAQTFTVPIDSTVTSVTFSLSGPVPAAVSITRPSGAAVNVTDPGLTYTTLSSGVVYTISAPEVGNWQLGFNGFGSFSYVVQGTTTLDHVDDLIRFNQFNFVTLAGRLGHEGYYPIQGSPLIGSTQTGLAELLGDVGGTATFKLVTALGSDLQPINLATGDPQASPGQYVGTFTIPSQPFRVAAVGTDNAGHPFQRVFSTLSTGQSISLGVDNTIDSLTAGTTTSLNYKVSNPGPTDTFSVTAFDNRGFVTGVAPSVVTLATGESQDFSVQVTVPAGTANGTVVQVTPRATSTSNPGVRNSGVQVLTVLGSPVCSPPVLTLSTQSVVAVLPTASATGVAVDLSGISSATSNCDPSPIVTNNAPTLFSIGITTVTFTATDRFGNSSQAQLTVHIEYVFGGYLPPLGRNASFQSGSTIPVQFQLFAADHTIVTNATASIDVFAVGPGGTLVSVLATSSGRSNSGIQFRFDPKAQLYIYNLSTIGYAPGTYLIRSGVSDLTTHDTRMFIIK